MIQRNCCNEHIKQTVRHLGWSITIIVTITFTVCCIVPGCDDNHDEVLTFLRTYGGDEEEYCYDLEVTPDMFPCNFGYVEKCNKLFHRPAVTDPIQFC